ncbi:unnamed protein product [Linum tenue]|uniref:Uncharacterized protein n=1 Tax=Linum tenue TaxID=586396 RepID=A0AAV0QV26_9ROSI|nr:unnamed protein product [Linum tenue]
MQEEHCLLRRHLSCCCSRFCLYLGGSKLHVLSSTRQKRRHNRQPQRRQQQPAGAILQLPTAPRQLPGPRARPHGPGGALRRPHNRARSLHHVPQPHLQ